jgi:uncharacterized protein
MTWQLSITGLLIGLLVGMTGMGGGALMTPILIFLFGFKPTLAVGTDILHGAVFKTFGAVRHRRLVQPRRPAGRRAVPARAARPDDRVLARHRGGFIVGLTSVGSGTFFALVMLLVFPLTAVKIVGTDIFHAAALLWVAGLSHFAHGNVDLTAMGWLLVGSVPGVLVGSRLTVRFPETTLRIALASVLLLSGVKLLDIPASDVIVVVALALLAIVFTVILVRRALNGRAAAAIGPGRS